jgi:GNAT superfamily N-acetyltransferase
MTAAPVLSVSDAPDAAAEAAIIGGLRAFNHAMLGTPSDIRPLQVVVRDPATREPLGGVSGHTLRGLLFVDFVFLPEALRGTGLAARMLGLAEAEAQRRGCSAAVLYTLNPKSAAFYARVGYRAFGTVEVAPPGRSRTYMSKALGGE